MKKTFIAILAAMAVIGGIYLTNSFSSTTEYVAQPAPVTEVVPTDNVSEAQKQLDEAKKILDAEETEIKEDIKKSEARLEEIRQVRLSFSQAPGQVQ
jgi:peptidoglycan hydrolase CwlO-like protein